MPFSARRVQCLSRGLRSLILVSDLCLFFFLFPFVSPGRTRIVRYLGIEPNGAYLSDLAFLAPRGVDSVAG